MISKDNVAKRVMVFVLALSMLAVTSCTGKPTPQETDPVDTARGSETSSTTNTESSTNEGETGDMKGEKENTVKVFDLRVEDAIEPLGIGVEKNPSFSWKFSEDRRNVTQKAYRITIGTAEGASDAYAGEWIESDEQYAVTCDGFAPVEKTRYYWSVEVKDDQNNVGSASSYFETALTNATWEQATWIGGTGIRRLRSEITLKDDVKNARVYVTGLGYYEFYINGQKVGDRVLDPAYGNYFEIVRYACFDVTDMLTKGSNALGMLLASGLYVHGFSKELKGIMYLNVEYASGENEVFVTDNSWKMTESSAFTREDAYSGEDYDARLEDGWLTCGYDDSMWEKAKSVDEVLPVEDGVIITNCTNVTICPETLGTDDYVIETEIEIVTLCGEVGFRATDEANCYMWQFNPDKLRAHIWSAGGVTVIEQPYGINPYNEEGRIPVRIEVKGNTIRTTVNGKQLPDITDTKNPTGTIGFRAWADSFVNTKFYNYKVMSLSGDVIYTHENIADWDSFVDDKLVMEPQIDPIRVILSEPVSVTKHANGNYIVDTGVNSTGWIKLQNLNAPAGTKITVRYAEILKEDGTIDYETLSREYVSSYIMDGSGNESWSHKFCFVSYRYVEISGYDGLTEDNVVVERVHTDVETTGSFESSNELLNKIQAAYVNSQLSNLMSLPMDPSREKGPWLGDVHVTSEASIYNFNMITLYERWFHDWRTTQHENGHFNLKSPDPVDSTGPSSGYLGGDVVWTCALMVIPWDVYQATGDISVLEENYDMIQLHAQWLMTHEPSPNMGPTMHWDWTGPDKNSMTRECVGTAYYYHAINLTAQIAHVLGRTEDAEIFDKKAEDIYKTFNRAFFKRTYYDTNTQTVNAIALAFGLVDEKNIDAVMKSLEEVILVEKEGHMSVGVAGVRALPAALTMYERPDLTYLMMTQKSYPGLGFMIESGATSLWEYWEHYDWDGVGQGGSNPRYFRALNHCFLGGGFSTWVYADLLGITAAEAGYDRIQIRPQIPGDLTYAKGQVETVHGTVKVDWIVDETGNLTMKVTVPANTVADVYVPIRGEAGNVTITEGGDTWFDRGEAKTDAYTETTDTHVAFRLGSGEYIFTVSGEGTYPFA